MALTLDNIIAGILDRLNAAEDEFWLNANFLLYGKDFLRRDDVREACWHQELDDTQDTVADQTEYTLPANYWRTEEVYLTIDEKDQLVFPGALAEVSGKIRWALWGGVLRLSPAPDSTQAGYTIKHYYLRPSLAPSTTTATLDMPDSLGEALQAYLMGRAMEKGGPEMARQAAQYHAEAQARVAEAINARKKTLGAPGFQQRVRW